MMRSLSFFSSPAPSAHTCAKQCPSEVMKTQHKRDRKKNERARARARARERAATGGKLKLTAIARRDIYQIVS